MEQLLLSLKDAFTHTDMRSSPEADFTEDDSDLDQLRSQFAVQQAHLRHQARSIQSQLHSTKKKLSKALKKR